MEEAIKQRVKTVLPDEIQVSVSYNEEDDIYNVHAVMQLHVICGLSGMGLRHVDNPEKAFETLGAQLREYFGDELRRVLREYYGR